MSGVRWIQSLRLERYESALAEMGEEQDVHVAESETLTPRLVDANPAKEHLP
jgi:hypothetical protein